MTVATTAASIYPKTWDSFIGQEGLKRQLQVACQSAKARNEPLRHYLFAAGEGGVGKSALARLVAMELGQEPVIISGKRTVNDLRLVLADMHRLGVIIYDEIHQGMPKAEEWLLPLLLGDGLPGPVGMEVQPEVTILGATTEQGRLSETILSRFKVPTLMSYKDHEAVMIGELFSHELFSPHGLPEPSPWNLGCIAAAANNNPRMIGKVLENLRDLAMSDITLWGDHDYNITEALSWEGLTDDGLTTLACRYLVVMRTQFRGSAGKDAIAGMLQEPGGVGYAERLLMDKGLLTQTGRGRTLTQAGIARANELARAQE